MRTAERIIIWATILFGIFPVFVIVLSCAFPTPKAPPHQNGEVVWHPVSVNQAVLVANAIHLGPTRVTVSAGHYTEIGGANYFYCFKVPSKDIPTNWDKLAKVATANPPPPMTPAVQNMPDWWQPSKLPDARTFNINVATKIKMAGYWVVYSRAGGVVYVDNYHT